MLTDHQWSPVTFILGQFHKRCLNHQLLKSENYISKISCKFPRGQWVKTITLPWAYFMGYTHTGIVCHLQISGSLPCWSCIILSTRVSPSMLVMQIPACVLELWFQMVMLIAFYISESSCDFMYSYWIKLSEMLNHLPWFWHNLFGGKHIHSTKWRKVDTLQSYFDGHYLNLWHLWAHLDHTSAAFNHMRIG